MEPFFDLDPQDQLDALQAASNASGRPAHLLEKDIWVVWSLRSLFTSEHGRHLVFKGGTSLSKAYDVIRRFSEDIDLTYDIRAIAPDLIDGRDPPLPSSRSQAARWKDKIADRLDSLLADELLPSLAKALASLGASARKEGQEKIFIDYTARVTGTGYVKPTVILEFGARSTGEPHETRWVRCDAAAHLPNIEFPEANPMVLSPHRTFWEKATAIHVFCRQGTFRGGDRFSRHWYDLTRLDATGFVDDAIKRRDIAKNVASHKSIFFAEKHEGKAIDYQAAVSGGLQLVPEEAKALAALEEDYRRMVEDGLLLGEPASFQSLIEQCKAIEAKANRASKNISSSPGR